MDTKEPTQILMLFLLMQPQANSEKMFLNTFFLKITVQNHLLM